MVPLLEANNISRKYGDDTALKPATFTLDAGQVISLTGPNGAGKSTMLLTLSGLIAPTTGTIKVEGHDLYRDEVGARRRLAYVPDVPMFYHELTAWEHVLFIAHAHSAADGFDKRARALLGDFGLWDLRDLFPHAYSRGMRLKLGLALALIRPLKVLLLDEPTSALDAASIEALAAKLQDLRSSGAAVMLTTHDAAFASHIDAAQWTMQDGLLHQDGVLPSPENDPQDDKALRQGSTAP